MRSGRIGRTVLLVLLLCLVNACTNFPPPPLVKAPPTQHTAAKPTDLEEVVVGLDRFGRGFNPHKIADQSTLTTALATEMLPSVFRPAADGGPMLDRTVMESAEVTSRRPFTVTYTMRTDAAWSDGVPVRAEDFQYLRDQMVNQPGVLNPEGYRHITDISSDNSGRIVRVGFDRPYPGWRSLFNNLLPGHILKDSPGGWDFAFSDGYPASAGPYMPGSFDRGRGEILLDRNERYWAQPSGIAHLMFRRADAEGVAGALRSGDSQLATVSSDDGTAKALGSLGDSVRTVALPRDAVAQLFLRPVGPLADQRVREAVASAMDREQLIAAGGGQRSKRVDALTLAPSQPGYRPTMPPEAPGAELSRNTVTKQLRAAGYQQNSGSWSLPELTVAAPADTEPYVSIARAAVQQLRTAGIPAKLSTPPPGELFGKLAGDDSGKGIDLLVAPRSTGDDPVGALSSWYGCPGGQQGSHDHGSDDQSSDEQSSDSQNTLPNNPGRICLRDLQPRIDSLVNGDELFDDVLPDVERGIWNKALTMPLFQVTDLLAMRKGIENVRTDPEELAPYPSAPEWKRVQP